MGAARASGSGIRFDGEADDSRLHRPEPEYPAQPRSPPRLSAGTGIDSRGVRSHTASATQTGQHGKRGTVPFMIDTSVRDRNRGNSQNLADLAPRTVNRINHEDVEINAARKERAATQHGQCAEEQDGTFKDQSRRLARRLSRILSHGTTGNITPREAVVTGTRQNQSKTRIGMLWVRRTNTIINIPPR